LSTSKRDPRRAALHRRERHACSVGSAAWKFTARTEHSAITVGSASADGETSFYVSDNGAGFDMAHVSKLFGAFQRLHVQEDFEGDGLGLALVQRIVLRHGGRVWATGAVDRGATISFTLPVPR